MKAIQLSRNFTLVVFILFSCLSLNLYAQGTGSQSETYEQCEARARRSARDACRSETTNYTSCIERETNNRIDSQNCETKTREADRERERSECTSLYNEYNQTNSRAAEECAEAEQASVQQCIAAANQCGASFSMMSAPGMDGNPFAGIMNLLSIANTVPGDSESCTIPADPDEQSRIQDQILSLKDEINDFKREQAEFRTELAEKEKDIKEEIREARKEIDEEIADARNENIQKAADIAKQVLEAQQRKSKNLIQIGRKNTEMANLEFASQQINIEFSESRIARKCYEKVKQMRDRLLAGQSATAPEGAQAAPAPAPQANRRFTLREIQRIKKELREEESDCLKTERLSRSAQLKGKLDRRQEILDDIKELGEEVKRDEERIRIDREAFEQEKANLTEQERKKLASIDEMVNNLNSELAALRTSIDERKVALDQKIASREQRIQELMTQKQNRKPRYSKVSSVLSQRDQAMQVYRAQCCRSGTIRHSGCGATTGGVQFTDPVEASGAR